MDYFHYTREYLVGLKIQDLRVLGSELKLKSPTSMKKEELIDAILKVTEDNTIDEISRTVKKESQKRGPGRPRKSATAIELKDTTEEIAEVRRKEEESSSYDALSSMSANFDFAEEPKPQARFSGRIKKSGFPPRPAPVGGQTYATPDRPLGKVFNKKFQDEPNANQNANVSAEPEKAVDPESIEIKEGVLEILPDGYGFLRAHNYEAGDGDAYISSQKIKSCGLRKGDWVKAEAQKSSENRPRVLNVLSVNGRSPENLFRRKNFDSLTPIYPNERFRLEIPGAMNDFAIRCIDMIAPIGKGQRAMIVSPPKAGKTTFLKKVAHSISANYPDAHLIVLLIDERPEEVTDMKRCIDGEVVFSTFDEMPEHHTKAAEMVLERAKRLVELGEDVVILMDSLTRLARAYNLTIAPTGRTLSGGIDPGALHSPKRFFGAARNIEFGGSLTIIATALVDTGSRMDDVIYEEFKGTGNMEIHLDRRLSEKRIFPAIDLYKSSTRMEELLLDQNELQGVWAMRKLLGQGDSADATENLLNMIVKTKTNKEFLEQVNLQVMALQKRGFGI